MLAMLASWSITKQVKGYLILFLLLETGMLGVFLSLDFFLFYVFWEVMLLPMYFLIGIWGGPRKEYAAIKFFLYTLAGSVLMLIAMLMFYFGSEMNFDLMELSQMASDGRGRHDLRESDAANHGVRAVVHRVCDQGADLPVPYLASRCPRRSPHADQYDPGRRAA